MELIEELFVEPISDIQVSNKLLSEILSMYVSDTEDIKLATNDQGCLHTYCFHS